MLVAFLYDLRVRSQSRGNHSLDDVYRGIFHDYHVSGDKVVADPVGNRRETNGNQAAMTELGSAAGMQDFAQSFIQRPVTVDLQSELAPFGLRVERLGLRTRVSVKEPLTRRLRDLLRELGYNDYARSSR
jgi:predicted metalloprotease with PDZ domain